KDLKQGMKLEGVVTNLVAFGAFVDIGVHQDGLVHVSQLADRFVKDPADVVKVGQKVSVTVMNVDLDRNRIALSMKSDAAQGDAPRQTAAAKRSARTPNPARR
ncbi:MAG: S1 RNA-binding domain-containing protein, partial [Gemmatimonadetes bacterium]|nr:S1 RNA-binding domain-containing protein [Gemmatimonadota bacterium]